MSATKLDVVVVNMGVVLCLLSPDDGRPIFQYVYQTVCTIHTTMYILPPLSPQALYILYREVFKSISCSLLIMPIYLLNLITDHVIACICC